MPEVKIVLIYVLIYLATKCGVHSFNLEFRLPIIKVGDINSYFGYSVASHIQHNADGTNENWLLIGAPKGQNLQPNTNVSGALYKCPVTQSRNDCTQVITDGYKDDSTELNPPSNEIKDGQWLGVTVRTQFSETGKVLVCAHRYIVVEGSSQHGQGLCYILQNNLEFDEAYEPCKGRSTKKAHEEYSFCQVGTSGMLLDDNTMILGSPGPYTWRGTIFVTAFGGDYLSREKYVYFSEHDEEKSPVDKYSYLGMAVTGGKYYSSNYSYAAGAPRESGHGEVLLFSKARLSEPLQLHQRLQGEQFASSFGYELATADINGDYQPDLLVAAPFYFTRNEGGAVYVYQNEHNELPSKYTLRLTGKVESRFGLALANIGDLNKDGCDDIAIGAPYEGHGAVYIYLGSVNGLSKEPSQIIYAADLGLYQGFKEPLTTFGSSLSGGIDIDNNSYPDLLVGAYNSSAAIAILARPITNITTKIMDSSLVNIDPTKQGCTSDPGTNLTCFEFETCCSIKQYELSPVTTLQLTYTLEAETFVKRYSRVFFGPESNKRSNIVKRNIYVETTGGLYCQKEIAYVKGNTKDIQTPIEFRVNYTIVESVLPTSGLIKLNPILDQIQADRKFKATFMKDCGADDVCQTNLVVKANLNLEKDENDVSHYKLILRDNEEIKLNINVTNEGESAYEAHLFIVHQPSVYYIGASKGAANCYRHNTSVVNCSIGNPMRRDATAQVTLRFSPKDLDDSETTLSFNVFANSTSKQIIEHEPMFLVTKVVKKAELSIQGWARPEQTFYGGQVVGESAIKYLDQVGTAVEHSYQIYNDGPWKAPEIEVRILWPFEAMNNKEQGKWLLYLEDKPLIQNGNGGGKCDIDDKYINPLKLERREIMDALVQEPPQAFTRRNFNSSAAASYTASEKSSYSKFSSASQNRVKRDRTMIVRAEPLIDKDGKKTEIVHMDCNKKTAKCIAFTCYIYKLERKAEAYIHIKSRLWNSTLVADYPKVDLVKIVSHAEIRVPTMYENQQNTSDDRVSVETHSYPELIDTAGDGSVPIWIIIVAIVGGLLLFALVTFILWKFGFFKRRRPDPTLSGNLEKNSSESKPFISK